jgi:hypothetical protein
MKERMVRGKNLRAKHVYYEQKRPCFNRLFTVTAGDQVLFIICGYYVFVSGCKTWSLALRHFVCLKELRRRIFGPKRGNVTGGWRKHTVGSL